MDMMRLTTAIFLLIWQGGLLLRHIENRRSRRAERAFWERSRAFWERHDKNMEAIESGKPLPYPDNSFNWPVEKV